MQLRHERHRSLSVDDSFRLVDTSISITGKFYVSIVWAVAMIGFASDDEALDGVTEAGASCTSLISPARAE